MSDLSTIDALRSQEAALKQRYADYQAQGLSLDMTRGKPCAEQLDLSLEMLSLVGPNDTRAADGTDCRNYGGLDGLPEAKQLFADYMEVSKDEVIIGGNSSLAMMHDTLLFAMTQGVPGSSAPWSEQARAKQQRVKFICPSPGYDRHFAICQRFNIEMLTVDFNADGPDMTSVEALVAQDEQIKGIWIVPKYSNPTGHTLSDDIVQRLARLNCRASDFRIFWDNAYAVHHLTEQRPKLQSLATACSQAGTADRVFAFGSTSKISFAGAGVAVMAASPANAQWMRTNLSFQTIGPDKLNQLRHVRFFKDLAGIEAHMKKHAAILKPKFDAVESKLSSELAGIAEWTTPRGGYFSSVNTPDHCAKRTIELANAAGVRFTSAGATYPLGLDPRDRNIRVAPSLPSLPDIQKAMDVFCTCVKLAALEKVHH